ncbi:MAG: DUF4190 domain-containing protein [Acidobacteriia bacterium]|nr:DUF4190 domain-containing protein [Terriglobia bacterium]
MFCFKCGFNMPDTATVCPQCNTPVTNAPQPPAPSPSSGQPASPWLNVPAMQAMPSQVLRPGMEPPTDGKATASLVLGILSVTCLWIFAGIPAVVLGHMSRKKIQESMGRLKGGWHGPGRLDPGLQQRRCRYPRHVDHRRHRRSQPAALPHGGQ